MLFLNCCFAQNELKNFVHAYKKNVNSVQIIDFYMDLI